jgi:hypothetical protein
VARVCLPQVQSTVNDFLGAAYRGAYHRNMKIAWRGFAAAALVAGAASADTGSLAAPLCGVLKGVGPRTREYEPEEARAQLVLSIAAAFDYDAAKLKQVRVQIDDVTAKACPKERDLMLGNTKTKTLAEAIE